MHNFAVHNSFILVKVAKWCYQLCVFVMSHTVVRADIHSEVEALQQTCCL